MTNVHDLEAEYILPQLQFYASYIESAFISLVKHTPFLFPFLITFGTVIVTLYMLRKLWMIKGLILQRSVFLELTPPALTQKTAYTTQQLFSVLYSIGDQRTF